MGNNISVTLFASDTVKGKNLATQLINTFEQKKVAGFEVNFIPLYGGSQGDMIIAGLKDDIIIFDASVEDEIGANYQSLHMWPSSMEHFLVVSRTRLPTNFLPFHRGGTPDLAGLDPHNSYELDNDYLINWIISKIEQLSPDLPRPEKERMEVLPNEFFSKRKEIMQLAEAIIARSSLKRKKYHKDQGQAFVSYLSRYSKYYWSPPPEQLTVENLISYIKETHESQDYPVMYYPPGTLSSEFMTEHRRWEVLSLIDWRIRSADEFWIYETEDYYDSWWTLAELSALAYIKHHEPEAVPRVILCQPVKGGWESREAPADFIQQLDYSSERGYGRRLSNSDPLTGGRETIKLQQKIAKMPVPLKWLAFQGGNLLSKVLLAGSSSYQQMKEDKKGIPGLGSFKHYRDMLKSPVYQDAFWENSIVSCTNCTASNNNRYKYDFQKFLLNKLPGQHVLTKSEASKVLSDGYWVCPDCDTAHHIARHDHPQYYWWPMRRGRPTGPDGCFVEKKAMYEFRKRG